MEFLAMAFVATGSFALFRFHPVLPAGDPFVPFSAEETSTKDQKWLLKPRSRSNDSGAVAATKYCNLANMVAGAKLAVND
ncbi:MAG TPA: hypothetical protein VH374_09040 [Polyangia bacterium]|jgi:hypothetical protein|nr:hypothetical protein [Polyangia bacterium]